MIFYDERKLDGLSGEEFQALVNESLAYDDILRRNGHFVAAQALRHVNTAATVRNTNGNISIMDGPFAETHEQIGGFILLEAGDMNEATHLASQIPATRLGGVEVRPVKDLCINDRAGEMKETVYVP